MAFVLDNSVVCGWLIERQASAYSDAVARRLADEIAHAPALLQWEYVNVLRTACRRGSLSTAQAQNALVQLQRLPIRTDTEAPLPSMLFALTLRHELSSYDALYLELGLRLQLPIATQDAALAAAAEASGLGLFEP